ncbi:hypothetical protein B0H12DRAFT_221048 [Mycena haematopus]|nr:hypothetical protein B0H12DRAFT_221048 [Mycena haematopus]
MPLRRLSVEVEYLFGFPSAGIDFTHPLFSHITHLQLRDFLGNVQWEKWRGLAIIPNLTHLAFTVEKSLSFFQSTLTACPGLQVLIFLYYRPNPGVGLESLAQDTRFVCLRIPILQEFEEDWQIGARGGDDFWVHAERFIAQRNCGEIDREFPVGSTCVADGVDFYR